MNGTIENDALFEPPFTDIASNGLIDVFDPEKSALIVNVVKEVNRNAVVA